MLSGVACGVACGITAEGLTGVAPLVGEGPAVRVGVTEGAVVGDAGAGVSVTVAVGVAVPVGVKARIVS